MALVSGDRVTVQILSAGTEGDPERDGVVLWFRKYMIRAIVGDAL